MTNPGMINYQPFPEPNFTKELYNIKEGHAGFINEFLSPTRWSDTPLPSNNSVLFPSFGFGPLNLDTHFGL